jgi:CHAT domain-containing protein
LRNGEVAIEYALAPWHSIALAITRDRVARYALDGREQIEAAIESYLAAVRGRRDSRTESKALYDLLLRPVVSFKESKAALVIPDGQLHLVAFDSLIDPEGRYVVDSHVISYAPSATAYYLLSRPLSSPPQQMTLLAVGGAHYISSGPGNFESALRGFGFFDPVRPPRWPALPGSLTEVNDVAAEQFGKTFVLTGDEATESAVKRLPLSNFRMLHFAVHSTVDEEFPDRSALIFSTPDNTDSEDNLLQAREIVGLNINAELVTLSACDAGTGRIEGVAGMNSLVEAFLMAGARSVVASTWSADDTFTAALMRRFYTNLRQGLDKAEALTLAKRELLYMHGPNALPFYWAGFRLVGDAHGSFRESDR